MYENITEHKARVFIKVALSFLTMIFSMQSFGQTGVPSGSCGIEYKYDAAGNMIERHYVCNNSANALYAPDVFKAGVVQRVYQTVSTIYPNPTTGKFQIRMANPLQNVKVEIINSQGATILRKNMSGSLLDFNLSGSPSGVYFIKIYDTTEILSMQVIKQ